MKNLFITILLVTCSFSINAQVNNLDGKTFILENFANGTALAVNGLNIGKNGTAVHSWPLVKNNLMEQWKFVASGDEDNMYYIINTSPQTKEAKYLEVASQEVGKNGGNVRMWANNGGSSGYYGANQVWIVNQSGDGYYNFTSAHATGRGAYALELSGNDIDKNGGKIQIWRNQGYKNQKWKLIPVENNSIENFDTKQEEEKEVAIAINDWNSKDNVELYEVVKSSGNGVCETQRTLVNSGKFPEGAKLVWYNNGRKDSEFSILGYNQYGAYYKVDNISFNTSQSTRDWGSGYILEVQNSKGEVLGKQSKLKAISTYKYPDRD